MATATKTRKTTKDPAAPPPAPLRACPRCGGKGKVAVLEGVAGETLALLLDLGREAGTGDLARLAGVRRTAMYNRLMRLQELGMASGRLFGHQWFWRATVPRKGRAR